MRATRRRIWQEEPDDKTRSKIAERFPLHGNDATAGDSRGDNAKGEGDNQARRKAGVKRKVGPTENLVELRRTKRRRKKHGAESATVLAEQRASEAGSGESAALATRRPEQGDELEVQTAGAEHQPVIDIFAEDPGWPQLAGADVEDEVPEWQPTSGEENPAPPTAIGWYIAGRKKKHAEGTKPT